MSWDQSASGITQDRGNRVLEWLIEDDSCQFAVIGGELCGEVRAQVCSKDNYAFGRDFAGQGQPGQRPFCVLAELFFAGVSRLADWPALAVAAIIDGEDVEVLPVERGKNVYAVAQIPVRAVEVEDGEAGILIGNPPGR